MYKDYKKARDAAWNVLIRYRVDRLPVEITKICAYEGLVLLPYSQVVSELKTFGLLEHSERTDGFSLLHQKYFFLFYDDTKSRQRQRFTIAHEFGHYINGDVTEKPTYRNNEPSTRDDPLETAANIVASRILSPACVLWRLNAIEPYDIAKLCDISMEAAKWRSDRMKILIERDQICRVKYGHGCFLQSPLERKVYAQFFGTE